MPKLLQINVTANRGSTGRIAEQIGEKVIAAGWESYIAYGRDCGKSKSQLVKIGSRLGVMWHALMTRITDKHGLYSKIATHRLIRQIERINPDIIHLHNIHGYYINYKVLFDYLQRSNVPVVWTLHDCWSMTGHCSHFDSIKCDRWQEQCYDCPLQSAYPTSLVFDSSRENYIVKKRLFSGVKNLTLVPVSNWLAGVVANSYLNGKKVIVIHNGVDINMFTPIEKPQLETKHGLNGKRVILGVASPWSDKKGLSDFIKLSSHLSDDYKIVLIGLSNEQIAKMSETDIGLPRTNNALELAEWYSLADAFVNLTYEDTYPTTNLEAISCGTPVVTYRTGGSPESVTPETGRVVEQGDIEGIAKAIEELCAEDRAEMRRRCRDYAVKNFNKEDNYTAYLKLYENILKTR